MQCGEASASVKLKEEVKCDHTEITPEAEAIILYPSFGAPLLVNPNKPLRLFVLFERFLFELYREEVNRNKGKTKIVTPKTIEIINKSLKIYSWDGVKQDPGKNLFGSKGEAEANISIDLIKIMGSISGAGRKVFDKYGKLVGLMRPGTLNRYTRYYYRDNKKKKDRGYFAYLFEIEIRNYKLTKGLHDCAWKMHDPTGAANSMKPTPPFPERQDLIAQRYIENIGSTHVKQSTGYKIISKDGGNTQFEFENEPSCPLNNRHPIYVSEEKKLNVGQLTDIHISSRQVPLQLCQAQVLPDADTSPKIGEMVNVSFNTFKNLLDKMGGDKGVDVLALTGDLIDFNQNFNPAAIGGNWKTDFQRPSTLWHWMDPKRFDDPEQGEKGVPYPLYIDMLTVYSLLNDFVKTYKKPIIMLTGNHEAYDKPYGISPRIGQFQYKDYTHESSIRANEGIPADHNLTTYEAALLYGPAYGDFRKTFNFTAKYLDWFYMLFTPLSDITLTYGPNQSFTALEWEDEEQFLTNFGGGTLPRATRAVSDLQLDLLKEAGGKGQDRILLTHFTFVSYGYNYQITKEGEVNYNDFKEFVPTKATLMSNYEEGTFIKNRKAVYTMLYDGAFSHVFSGHSHRAGYYVMTEKDGFFSSNVKVKGHPIEETKLTTTAKLNGGKARFIVGASGGPLSGQNHYADPNEKGLSNWTLERPAGNVMNLRDDTLCLKPASLPSAKPRFAVALSFFNDLNQPVFKTFESGKGGQSQGRETRKDNEFTIELHPDLPGERLIKEITLYVHQAKWAPYVMSVAEKGQRNLLATVAGKSWASLMSWLLDKNLPEMKSFIRTTFTKALVAKTGYKQYNYDSPWIFPINITDKKKDMEALENMIESESGYSPGYSKHVTGYRIKVSKKAPDFMWYQKTFTNYATGETPNRTKDTDASKTVKMPS